jgi:hypothetical protein
VALPTWLREAIADEEPDFKDWGLVERACADLMLEAAHAVGEGSLQGINAWRMADGRRSLIGVVRLGDERTSMMLNRLLRTIRTEHGAE